MIMSAGLRLQMTCLTGGMRELFIRKIRIRKTNLVSGFYLRRMYVRELTGVITSTTHLILWG